MLSKVVKEGQRDWGWHWQKALLVYRTAIHETTGFSPYHLNFGCCPTLPKDIVLGNISEKYSSYPVSVQEVHAQLHSAYNTTKKRLQVLHQCQKKHYDQKATGEKLKIGDRVLFGSTTQPSGRAESKAL